MAARLRKYTVSISAMHPPFSRTPRGSVRIRRRLSTVLHVLVLAAFLGASATCFCTNATDFRRELSVGSHQQRCRSAKHRAVPVQLNASRQCFYVLLAQAGARAVGAFIGAVVTGFNAIHVSFVRHNLPFIFLFRAHVAPPRDGANRCWPSISFSPVPVAAMTNTVSLPTFSACMRNEPV